MLRSPATRGRRSRSGRCVSSLSKCLGSESLFRNILYFASLLCNRTNGFLSFAELRFTRPPPAAPISFALLFSRPLAFFLIREPYFFVVQCWSLGIAVVSFSFLVCFLWVISRARVPYAPFEFAPSSAEGCFLKQQGNCGAFLYSGTCVYKLPSHFFGLLRAPSSSAHRRETCFAGLFCVASADSTI